MRYKAIFLAGALACAATVATAADDVRLVYGSGDFVFTDKAGDASRPVTVYTYVPRRAMLTDAPILFVMHGFHRSAKAYRDDWAHHADRLGFIVVAPLFDEKRWGSEYAYPAMKGADGRPRDTAQTSFGLIEHLFDALRTAAGNRQTRYLIYGFSEGGQFVHRLVLTQPNARYSRAVIGTPGWYTMPNFGIAWPYGLKHTRTDRAALKKILERDVVLLLGAADNDPNHDELRKKRQAMAQGAHRVARGENFFGQAQAQAAELKANFAWRMQIVPGVAHEPKKMSPAAAANIAAPLR
jgi:poly(3-hydroxybutyrate) depolymerase